MYDTLITPEELNQHYQKKDWVLVDCRFSLADKEEGRRNYLEAHIPGAVYAHLDDDLSGPIVPGQTGRHPLPSVERASQFLTSLGIGEGVQVIAYDGKSGAIAARLWWMLKWLGHEQVAVLNGGIQAWQKAGFPLKEGVESNPARSFIAREKDDIFIDREAVKERTDDYLLIDSRTSERYRGELEPIDPIAGHIHGAVNYPHPNNVNDQGQWYSPEVLKNQITAITKNHTPDKVIFYCGSGVTACRNILAMEYAGLGRALLYPGSWSEWITKI
jgi:thiosulfate/3-mercaptopyruvate sulfurtransferase